MIKTTDVISLSNGVKDEPTARAIRQLERALRNTAIIPVPATVRGSYLSSDGTWTAPAGNVTGVTAGSAMVTATPTTGNVVVDVVPANFTGIPEAGVVGLVGDLASKVPTSRLINTTLPLTGGGSLASDLTLGVNVFTSTASGVVPASGGATVNFLRADVTWAHPMVIGSPVDSGTTGSVLFIGAGPVLAQDNANLFYDATNKRLGIGTNNPGGGYGIAPDLTMHLYRPAAHNLVLIESQGVSCDCGIAMYTRINGYDTAIFTDESDAQKLKFALGGYSTGGASPGDLSSHSGRQSATAMYIAQNGDVAIGSAVYWTSASKVLTITQSAADPADGTGCITLKNTLSSSLSQITWRDHTSAFKCSNGFSNSSGHFYWYTGTGVPIEINLNNGGTQHLFASDGGFQLAASTSAVSSASTGRFKYVSSGQKMQLSFNAGSYFDVATYAAALTTGQVLFANASNQIAQDSGLFWDNTAKRLGVGTNGPSQLLHAKGSISGDVPIYSTNTNTAGYSGIAAQDTAGNYKASWGFGNSAVGITVLQSKAFLASPAIDYVFCETTNSTVILTVGMTKDSAYLQYANGSSAAVGAANTGRRRYTTTGQKFQVSMNGGAYVDEVSASAAGTSNTTAKFTAANQIANGWALDDGTTWGVSGKFTITEATGAFTGSSTAHIVGAATLDSTLSVAGLSTLTGGFSAGTKSTVAYAASASPNNDHAFDVALSGTFDTTAGQLFPNGIRVGVTSTRGVGSNPLNNIAIELDATGGQNNYAIWTDHGDVNLNVSSGGLTAHGTAHIVGATTLDASLNVGTTGDFSGDLYARSALHVTGSADFGNNIGFYGTTPIAKPTASGSRGGNAALASLLTALANLGLITDSTTP